MHFYGDRLLYITAFCHFISFHSFFHFLSSFVFFFRFYSLTPLNAACSFNYYYYYYSSAKVVSLFTTLSNLIEGYVRVQEKLTKWHMAKWWRCSKRLKMKTLNAYSSWPVWPTAMAIRYTDTSRHFEQLSYLEFWPQIYRSPAIWSYNESLFIY